MSKRKAYWIAFGVFSAWISLVALIAKAGDVETWNTTASLNNSAAPNGAPEGWTGANVNDWARETMAAVKRFFNDPDWRDTIYEASPVGAKTLVRNSATQIQVSNSDVSTHFTTGQRIKIIGATTAKGYVASVSYSAPNTLVNVTMDGGDVPTAPTELLVHLEELRSAAFHAEGAGNGLDADTIDGLEVNQFASTLKNQIINGRLDLWQRGTSFSLSAAGTQAAYTADRFKADSGGGGGATTVSRQTFTIGQTDVPTNPRYYLRFAQTANASTIPILEQRIEDVRSLAGQSATVSFYAKAAGAFNVTGVLKQYFGTGGSPSADVNHALGTFGMTTSWARYTATVAVTSLAGKTAGTNDNDYLALRFEFPTAATFTLDIAGIQVERGTTASDLAWTTVDQELARAQRFYFKTYDLGVAPSTTESWGGVRHHIQSNGYWNTSVPFPVTMRAVPTVRFYSPKSGLSNGSYEGKAFSPSGAIDYEVTTGIYADGYTYSPPAIRGTGTNGTTINVPSTNPAVLFHVVADAEL